MPLFATLDGWLAYGAEALARACVARSDLTVFLCGMMTAHETAFLATNAFYFAVARVPALRKYKIQQDGKADPSRAQVWHAVKHVYFGRLVFQLPATIAYYFLWRACGGSMTAPAPAAGTALAQLVVMGVLMEVLFYSCHRAFHHRSLYKWHKRHHEFKSPVGVASEYASPLEDLVVNLPSTLLPGICFGVHPLVLYAWLMIRVWETVDVHSGFALPFSPFQALWGGPERHDYHHSHHTKGCYGSFGFMDRLLGTDAEFLKWKEGKRKTKGA